MRYTFKQERNRTILTISLIGMALGFIYSMFADGFDEPILVFNGMSIGLAGSFFVSVFELYVFNPHNRKLSFWLIVSLKTLFYFALMVFLTVVIKGFNESIYYNEGFWEHIQGPGFQEFLYQDDFFIIVLYSLIFIGIIIFIRHLSRKMGQGILLNFITGKYHEPREEERIFMFLDLNSSTSIAEAMGAIQYYQLLNDFFHDITKCILFTKGEIYRYVGDEVVVTWSIRDGLNNSNCIRTYFYVKNEIDRLKEKYLDKYNLVPGFSASFHVGKVIRGEIGDVKSQIVFHGGPLYTTALVEKQCGKLKKDILVTADLIKRISLPVIYEMKQVGRLELDRQLDLYTIIESELEAM